MLPLPSPPTRLVAPSLKTPGAGLCGALHGPLLLPGRSPTCILCSSHTKLISISQLCLPKAPFLQGLFTTPYSNTHGLMAAAPGPGPVGFHSASFSPQLGGPFLQRLPLPPPGLQGATLLCFPGHPHFLVLGLCTHSCPMSRSPLR